MIAENETQAVDGNNPLLYGSLFSGIGGMDLGFDRAGMRCAWQVEIDEYARKVLAKHWPEVPKHDDIRTFHGAEWPRVDVIAGGFPCQDISYAGKGAGLAGERSGLFFEAMRVVREVGPRVVVLENVSALLTRGLDAVLGTLASLGYDAEWHCIPAAAVGAPHRRDRVFIVSYAQGERFRTGRAWGIAGAGSWQEDTADVADTQGDEGGKRDRDGKDYGRNWATEPAVGRVANGVPARVDRLRGLGNAVVPQVAEWIGRRIVQSR